MAGRQSIDRRRIEASFELVEAAFRKLAEIAGLVEDESVGGVTVSEQIQALGTILGRAHKYYPELKSFGNIEKRLYQSLETGGALYNLLIQRGWTPPTRQLQQSTESS